MQDFLTLNDLAKRWGVKLATLYVRRHRGHLPEPDMVVSRVPMWSAHTIEEYERGSNGDTERES